MVGEFELGMTAIGCLDDGVILVLFRHGIPLRASTRQRERIHLFFIRTPFFLPSLDVLIFLRISASYVLIDVLNYFYINNLCFSKTI